MTAAERFVKRMLTSEDGEGEVERETAKAVSPVGKGGAAKPIYRTESRETKGTEDEAPKKESLAEHDKHYHPRGYKDGDECSLRETLMAELGEEISESLNVERKPGGENTQKGHEDYSKDLSESLSFIQGDEVTLPSQKDTQAFAKQVKSIRKSIDDREKQIERYDETDKEEAYLETINDICKQEYELAVETAKLIGFSKGEDKFQIESRQGINKETVKNLALLLSMFTGCKQDGPFYVWGKAFDQRATTGLAGMNVSRDARFRTYIHEAAHWLEYNSEAISKRCIDFLRYRTQGEPYIHVGPNKDRTLKEGEYKGMKVDDVPITEKILMSPKWEIGKKDRFYHPYCGKMYFQKGDSGQPELFGTEILSMGMEALFTYPEKFIQRDSEYARFVVGVLRGV